MCFMSLNNRLAPRHSHSHTIEESFCNEQAVPVLSNDLYHMCCDLKCCLLVAKTDVTPSSGFLQISPNRHVVGWQDFWTASRGGKQNRVCNSELVVLTSVSLKLLNLYSSRGAGSKYELAMIQQLVHRFTKQAKTDTVENVLRALLWDHLSWKIRYA